MTSYRKWEGLRLLDQIVGAYRYGPGMAESSDRPQTLYVAWSGRGLFRRYEYIGVTNSPSRRMREHCGGSDWWLEASTIRLRRYPDRASVLQAERTMIKAKRPRFNIEHNLDEIEAHVTVEDLAAIGALACLGILALEWLADTVSTWWIKRLAAQQDVPVTLPPRPNRFTDPSLPLTLYEAFSKVATGEGLPRPVGSPPVQVPAMPEGSFLPVAGDPLPVTQPVPANASALGWLVVLAYLYAGGQGAATASGGTGHGSGTGLAGSDVPDGPPNC